MSDKRIGRYEIRSELGRGGMATVYHAYDPNFERDVAIKILPEVFLHDPQFRARFNREAKMIALLEHPAIVPVYDFGESDEQPYIVMRYMSGGTLSDRLKQGALTLEETAQIINRLAPALDAAHAKGIIHRDIKPGNILFDQYGNAFLSDFGIAHLSVEGLTTLTGSSTLGTPSYMSPEQISGDRPIDSRSDIYALGVLIFQMLTGKIPYSADTPAKIMMMHVLEPVPQILAHQADLPFEIDGIITRAMAKNPDDRFATAGELATALEEVARNTYAQSSLSGIAVTPQTSFPSTLISPGEGNSLPTIKGGSSSTATQSSNLVLGESVPQGAKKSTQSLRLGLMIGAILIGMIGLFLFFNWRAGGAYLSLAQPTPTPSATQPPTRTASPTNTIALSTNTPALVVAPPTTPPTLTFTPEPTPTSAPTSPPLSPIIGGADKIAYLDGNNIFLANLDGTDRTQLTIDNAEKKLVQWSQDGQLIYYLLGKCIQTVNIETTAIDNINCFNFASSLKDFQISPDGEKVLLSLDNQLYILPFDLERLRQIKKRSELTDMADCKEFAPFDQFFAEGARWSQDGKTLSVILLANLGTGKRGNVIQVLAVDQCTDTPQKITTFPSSTFVMERYAENPVIQNFAYDGLFIYVLNNFVRNGGFGDLYAYNAELNKASLKINPINNRCCYRDSYFSPDGSYLIFAYQDFLQGADSKTQLYLVPFGSIGTGITYTPMPLPEIQNPQERPQPILRPAQTK